MINQELPNIGEDVEPSVSENIVDDQEVHGVNDQDTQRSNQHQLSPRYIEGILANQSEANEKNQLLKYDLRVMREDYMSKRPHIVHCYS